MKLLSVANIASPVGGTGRCAIDCVNALPHWQHANLFIQGNASSARSMRAALGWEGTQIWIGRRRVAEVVREWEPDLVLYHNQGPEEMPGQLHRNIPTAYYYHSAHERRPATFEMVVSRALADRMQWGHKHVLHQPVACPENVMTEGDKSVKITRAEQFTVGRLCTPHRSKWPEGIVPFYRRLANDNPNVQWEFVGCPPALHSELRHACSGRVVFCDARPDARAWLHRWHVVLYDGKWESYGRVACEAQQAGCVPIVSRGGGFMEQIDHGKTGYLCQTVQEFSSAIQSLRFGIQVKEFDPPELIQDVIENDFDLPSLSRLADWFDEQGDPRGEIIRVEAEIPETDINHRESLLSRHSVLRQQIQENYSERVIYSHWSRISRAAKESGSERGSLERWGRAFAELVGRPYGDPPAAKAA